MSTRFKLPLLSDPSADLLPRTNPSSSSRTSPSSPSSSSTTPRSRSRRRFRLVLAGLISVALIYLFGSTTIGIWQRDLGYILRPIWDTPDPPWDVISHYAPRGSLKDADVREDWCGLHGWRARSSSGRKGEEAEKPTIIDAILFSSELDLLEIRIREYLPFVDKFVIIESNSTFSGAPKSTYFANHFNRFDFVPRGKIIHHVVNDLEANLPKGSFENENRMRGAVTNILYDLAQKGDIPPGALVIHSDVDEILSRQTLSLLSTCTGYPSPLHLSVKNYRFSFQFPLSDAGYWRPKIITYGPSDPNSLQYGHGRGGNTMLGGAGWHCSFCFRTLREVREKMLGYSHNDRVRRKGLVDGKALRKKVCEGRDPFGMYPEAFSFKSLIAQSGKPDPATSFLDVPVAVKEDPKKFAFLLEDGCNRPDD